MSDFRGRHQDRSASESREPSAPRQTSASRGRTPQVSMSTARTSGSSPARGRSSSNRPSPPRASRIPAPTPSTPSPTPSSATTNPARRNPRQHRGGLSTAQSSSSGSTTRSSGGHGAAAGSMGPPPIPSTRTNTADRLSITTPVKKSDSSGERPRPTVADYQTSLKATLAKMKEKNPAAGTTSRIPTLSEKTTAGSSSTASASGSGSTQPPSLTGRAQSDLQKRLSKTSTQSASSEGTSDCTSPVLGRRQRENTSSESPPSDPATGPRSGQGKGKERAREKQPAKRGRDYSTYPDLGSGSQSQPYYPPSQYQYQSPYSAEQQASMFDPLDESYIDEEEARRIRESGRK